MPYNPQKDAVVISKPFGAVGFPIDSRSFFYDEANFVRRAFVSTAEVLAYFDTPFKREGMFYVFVNSTGTLQPDGTILGGERVAYWWKEGTADNQLIVVVQKGDKGDAFTFDDFTEEQIELLQQPALDAAVIALDAAEVANNAKGWQQLTSIEVVNISGIDKTVRKLVDWFGGTGTKPTLNVGKYEAIGGWANDPDDAISVLSQASEISLALKADRVNIPPTPSNVLDVNKIQRTGNVISNIIDQYTGEPITATKVTVTPTVDNIIYFQIGSEYFKRVINGGIYASSFGVKADGITDDYTALQKALDSEENVIYIDGNCLVSQKLIVPQGKSIIGIKDASISTNNLIILIESGSNTSFENIKFIYSGGTSAYNSNSIGIKFNGINSANYLDNLSVNNCSIIGFRAYGFYGEFVSNVTIKNSLILNIGYTGVGIQSGTNVNILNSIIKGITPGTSSNAYNVFFGRAETTTSLVDYPRSNNCSVKNCLIEDNIIFEGLDTHAGDGITFQGNIINNVKVGVALVGSSLLTGYRLYAPLNCNVIGNIINGINNGENITIAGAGSALIGSPNEYARNVNIIGNTMSAGGNTTSVTTGAIRAITTLNLNIQDNSIYLANINAICLLEDNKGFNINGGSITDPFNDVNDANGIIFRAVNCSGHIGGVSFVRGDKVATKVANNAIIAAGSTNPILNISPNYSSFITELSGLLTSDITYGRYGLTSVKKFAGSEVTPNGSRTASEGSEFIKVNGVFDTIFWRKFSGSGNTGWLPVQGVHSGTTASRPTVITIGYAYFDTTIGQQVIWNGTSWIIRTIIDATSTPYTKTTINIAYPTANIGTIVVQDLAGLTYIKKDNSSTGNWSKIASSQLA